jgi:hypothetical protein
VESNMDRLQTLRTAVANIRLVVNENVSPVGSEWLEKYGIALGAMNVASGRLEGFTPGGALAVSQFAAYLLDTNPKAQRGVTYQALVGKLSDTIRTIFSDRVNTPVAPNDLATVMTRIIEWLDHEVQTSEHFILCRILPQRSTSFMIGPVLFAHKDTFVFPKSVQSHPAFSRLESNLKRATRDSAADWIAHVEVCGCQPRRAEEVADITVDLAIAVLQVIIAPALSNRMTRVTARSFPVSRENLAASADTLHLGGSNLSPGLGISSDRFERNLATNAGHVEVMGRRIAAYNDGSAVTSQLEQSWCDAAYWFHEGVAEPLDTIAVPKLATSLEILFGAGSAAGSTRRLREAFAAFFDWQPDELIGAHSLITTNHFIEMIVCQRSRLLHGTSSTLRSTTMPDRLDIMKAASQLLAAFAFELDGYKHSKGFVDETGSFLTHVQAVRNSRRAAP